VPAKRGDRVTPPPQPGGWDVRFDNNDAAKGWEEFCQVARANTWEAWIVLSERPTKPENPARQHRMKSALSTQVIRGRTLEQWQYEVTSGGRIWYCPDPERRIVWVVDARTRHPKATE
jgi:hypothetical protein